jgi:hypothetical protein
MTREAQNHGAAGIGSVNVDSFHKVQQLNLKITGKDVPAYSPNTSLSLMWHQTIPLPILEHERLRIFVVETLLLLVTQAMPRGLLVVQIFPYRSSSQKDPVHLFREWFICDQTSERFIVVIGKPPGPAASASDNVAPMRSAFLLFTSPSMITQFSHMSKPALLSFSPL